MQSHVAARRPCARHSPLQRSGAAHAFAHFFFASLALRIGPVSTERITTAGAGTGGSSHAHTDITVGFVVRQPPFHFAGGVHTFGHFSAASA